MTVRIDTIDLEYLGAPGTIAAYLVRGDAGPVLVEAGPANTHEALDRGLRAHGVEPTDVRHVLVTHIHFDHAGNAGRLAQRGATIHVHGFGAPHLIDPSKLMASAGRIYGDKLEALWGLLVPAPAERVHAVEDGDVLEVEGLRFRAIESPGHARHHHAFALHADTGTDDDARTEHIAFTGDAASTFIAACPTYNSPPMPPPEFDLEAWCATLDRFAAERFDALYPTHFGRVDDVAGHLDRTRAAITAHAEKVHALLATAAPEDEQRAAYRDWYYAGARAAGLDPDSQAFAFYVKDTMAAMNYSGLARYWRKRAERAAGSV